MRRLLALVFALLILVSPAAMSEEDQLTEEETQMLIDLLAERDEAGRAFVVLPEKLPNARHRTQRRVQAAYSWH